MKTPKRQKRPQFDESEIEKSQGFIDYKSDRYILLPSTLPQRKLNRTSNLGKETKNLTYLVSILKN